MFAVQRVGPHALGYLSGESPKRAHGLRRISYGRMWTDFLGSPEFYLQFTRRQSALISPQPNRQIFLGS